MPKEGIDAGDIYMLQTDESVLEKYRKRLSLGLSKKKYVRIVSTFKGEKTSKVREDKQVKKKRRTKKVKPVQYGTFTQAKLFRRHTINIQFFMLG